MNLYEHYISISSHLNDIQIFNMLDISLQSASLSDRVAEQF